MKPKPRLRLVTRGLLSSGIRRHRRISLRYDIAAAVRSVPPISPQTFVTMMRTSPVRRELVKQYTIRHRELVRENICYLRSRPSMAVGILSSLTGGIFRREGCRTLVYKCAEIPSAAKDCRDLAYSPEPVKAAAHIETALTPHNIRRISAQAVEMIFERLELERIRRGYGGSIGESIL